MVSCARVYFCLEISRASNLAWAALSSRWKLQWNRKREWRMQRGEVSKVCLDNWSVIRAARGAIKRERCTKTSTAAGRCPRGPRCQDASYNSRVFLGLPRFPACRPRIFISVLTFRPRRARGTRARAGACAEINIAYFCADAPRRNASSYRLTKRGTPRRDNRARGWNRWRTGELEIRDFCSDLCILERFVVGSFEDVWADCRFVSFSLRRETNKQTNHAIVTILNPLHSELFFNYFFFESVTRRKSSRDKTNVTLNKGVQLANIINDFFLSFDEILIDHRTWLSFVAMDRAVLVTQSNQLILRNVSSSFVRNFSRGNLQRSSLNTLLKEKRSRRWNQSLSFNASIPSNSLFVRGRDKIYRPNARWCTETNKNAEARFRYAFCYIISLQRSTIRRNEAIDLWILYKLYLGYV